MGDQTTTTTAVGAAATTNNGAMPANGDAGGNAIGNGNGNGNAVNGNNGLPPRNLNGDVAAATAAAADPVATNGDAVPGDDGTAGNAVNGSVTDGIGNGIATDDAAGGDDADPAAAAATTSAAGAATDTEDAGTDADIPGPSSLPPSEVGGGGIGRPPLDTAGSDGGALSSLGGGIVGPPSPLTGCYLLIILGEPHSEEHKDNILQHLLKGKLQKLSYQYKRYFCF